MQKGTEGMVVPEGGKKIKVKIETEWRKSTHSFNSHLANESYMPVFKGWGVW